MARARSQADDLAHGLKTPLTILAAESRRLTEHGDTAAALLISQQIATMRRHIDRQLARARAAGASRVAGLNVPIAPPIARLIRVMSRLHDHDALELTAAVDPSHRFAGDAQDLEEMIGNLLDNACKWAKRRVRLASRDRDGRLVILVDDDGPGLPAAQRDAVFERGRRLDQSVPGSGLGLAIVRDLAEIYGGSIGVEESPAGGLRARLELPTPGGKRLVDAGPGQPAGKPPGEGLARKTRLG